MINLNHQRILVTGGLGFIGANFIKMLLEKGVICLGNIDKVTYASNLDLMAQFNNDSRYHFFKIDLADADKIRNVIWEFEPDVVVHFAAESHVDRSISDSSTFIQTNVVGTFNLLEALREYSCLITPKANKKVRLIHVSTDEVYGTLGETGSFTEKSQYKPNSPYSASKAASDHLARAWHHTYGLPVIVTNCSNNYGPYQNIEKLIPTVISCCLLGKPIPVYGNGQNVRDWIHVDDHNRGILAAISNGVPGESYNLGGYQEVKNIDLILQICQLMDQIRPKHGWLHKDLITFVEDRKGHDYRYAINASKAADLLDWKAEIPLIEGLSSTLQWYIERANG